MTSLNYSVEKRREEQFYKVIKIVVFKLILS